ncbi:MAG: BrnT family toxin [Alphaproteobacteria bacterium]|nr:BrnT family toxin [Alphaproteobacteria bacterium]
MSFEFDPTKDAANLAKHGISLSRAGDMQVQATALDPYPAEPRFRAFGLIDDRAHCLIFTIRNGRRRAISLRRVRSKEYSRYVAGE